MFERGVDQNKINTILKNDTDNARVNQLRLIIKLFLSEEDDRDYLLRDKFVDDLIKKIRNTRDKVSPDITDIDTPIIGENAKTEYDMQRFNLGTLIQDDICRFKNISINDKKIILFVFLQMLLDDPNMCSFEIPGYEPYTDGDNHFSSDLAYNYIIKIVMPLFYENVMLSKNLYNALVINENKLEYVPLFTHYDIVPIFFEEEKRRIDKNIFDLFEQNLENFVNKNNLFTMRNFELTNVSIKDGYFTRNNYYLSLRPFVRLSKHNFYRVLLPFDYHKKLINTYKVSNKKYGVAFTKFEDDYRTKALSKLQNKLGNVIPNHNHMISTQFPTVRAVGDGLSRGSDKLFGVIHYGKTEQITYKFNNGETELKLKTGYPNFSIFQLLRIRGSGHTLGRQNLNIGFPGTDKLFLNKKSASNDYLLNTETSIFILSEMINYLNDKKIHNVYKKYIDQQSVLNSFESDFDFKNRNKFSELKRTINDYTNIIDFDRPDFEQTENIKLSPRFYENGVSAGRPGDWPKNSSAVNVNSKDLKTTLIRSYGSIGDLGKKIGAYYDLLKPKNPETMREELNYIKNPYKQFHIDKQKMLLQIDAFVGDMSYELKTSVSLSSVSSNIYSFFDKKTLSLNGNQKSTLGLSKLNTDIKNKLDLHFNSKGNIKELTQPNIIITKQVKVSELLHKVCNNLIKILDGELKAYKKQKLYSTGLFKLEEFDKKLPEIQ